MELKRSELPELLASVSTNEEPTANSTIREEILCIYPHGWERKSICGLHIVIYTMAPSMYNSSTIPKLLASNFTFLLNRKVNLCNMIV